VWLARRASARSCWFRRLGTEIRKLVQPEPGYLDRPVALQRALVDVIEVLDPMGSVFPRPMSSASNPHLPRFLTPTVSELPGTRQHESRLLKWLTRPELPAVLACDRARLRAENLPGCLRYGYLGGSQIASYAPRSTMASQVAEAVQIEPYECVFGVRRVTAAARR
jgi:hypothetical protein